MATRVLMINRQLAFAVAIKQALERTGSFDVHPFTTVDAAVEYLQGHPQDAALVDLTLADDVVAQLRRVQPEIAVIGTPRQPDEKVRALNLQASVNTPFSARDIIPVINAITKRSAPTGDEKSRSGLLTRNLPDSGLPEPPPQTRPSKVRPPDVPEYKSIETVLANMANKPPTDPPRQEQFVEFVLKDGTSAPTPDALSQRLAAEEPPAPTFEESGTVGDLLTGVTDTGFRNVLSLLRGEDVQDDPVESFTDQELREAFGAYYDELAMQRGQQKPKPAEDEPFNIDSLIASITPPEMPAPSQRFAFEDDEPGANTARIVLETALDESTPIHLFSVEDFLNSIERQLPPNRPKVQPLPSWVQESRAKDDERFVQEPDFLPPTLPEEIPQYDFDFAEQPTLPSMGQQIEEDLGDLATEWLQPTEQYFPDAPWLTDLPSDVPSSPPATLPEFEPEETFGATKPMDALEDVPPITPEMLPREESRAYVAPTHFDDPRLAQLALTLTQISLELTAEATLLARDGDIVAFAGRMERDDIEELRHTIADDWEAKPQEARIRFVTLLGSGKEYMLYTRLTEDDLTLSLIFAAATPLRDIRRQGKRLIDALQVVPEPKAAAVVDEEMPAVPQIEPPVAAGALTPYTYLWLVRDPNLSLNPATTRAIVSGMNVQLRELAWQIEDLEAHEDYVYLMANVPGDAPPYEVIRDLKRRAAAIVGAQYPSLNQETLWADSYLVVTPGRKLDTDEIQQFINFERM